MIWRYYINVESMSIESNVNRSIWEKLMQILARFQPSSAILCNAFCQKSHYLTFDSYLTCQRLQLEIIASYKLQKVIGLFRNTFVALPLLLIILNLCFKLWYTLPHYIYWALERTDCSFQLLHFFIVAKLWFIYFIAWEFLLCEICISRSFTARCKLRHSDSKCEAFIWYSDSKVSFWANWPISP